MAQIDLRRAARAFDQNNIGLFGEAFEAFQHGGHEARLQLMISARVSVAAHFALNDHLRPGFAFRFEQHRVHIRTWRDPGGTRLQGLGAADLGAALRHRRIVRHVLGFERAHFETAIAVGTAQPGDQQRLADMGAGALEHERCRASHGRYLKTQCRSALSRRP